MRLPRRDVSPYRLYLLLESGTAFLLGITNATVAVYWVISGRLNPLQLLLLGTALELSYFLLQLPTGVLADMISRRLCVLAGLFILGLGLVMQSLSPSFANLLTAQLVLGLGFALNSGALEAWVADELAGESRAADPASAVDPRSPAEAALTVEPATADQAALTIEPGTAAEAGGRAEPDRMTRVYMRATQLGLIGTIAGSLLSGVIALGGLELPLLVGGCLVCLLAVAAAFVMPEHHFRPAPRDGGVLALARRSGRLLAGQTRAAHRAIVAVPGLMLLFGMTMGIGMWSESFDRLWGAFLIRDIGFPRPGGLHPALWFSLLACTIALLGLGSTELARRRAERLGPQSLTGGLLVVTVGIGAGVVAMATAHAFAIAVAAYLFVSALRPVVGPLVDGWMVTRIEPSVRATALSAGEMFDSGGQIIGGPVFGVIGTLTSIRIALLAGAAALGPAVLCLAAASRRIRPRRAARTRTAPGLPR
jgi:DHA3 family tetracycline resistance protein-like MFS transporter